MKSLHASLAWPTPELDELRMHAYFRLTLQCSTKSAGVVITKYENERKSVSVQMYTDTHTHSLSQHWGQRV